MHSRAVQKFRRSVAVGILLFGSSCCAFALAQEAKDPTKDLPRVALAAPLAVPKGAATKLTLRGWKLDQAVEVRATTAGVAAKLIEKGTSPAPNGQDAKQIGDSKVDVELTVPAELVDEEVKLVVVNAAGASQPYALLVGGREPQMVEKESNDGFRQAQPVAVPQAIDGQIGADRDVDVYGVTLEAGQTLTIELVARRRGSGLDGFLTVYDERGRTIASNDDAPAAASGAAPDVAVNATADSRLTFAAPKSGRYLIVLQDAFDHGGPAHPYRLIVRAGKD